MKKNYSFVTFSLILTLVVFGVVIFLLNVPINGFLLVPQEYFRFIRLYPGSIYTDILLLFAAPLVAFLITYAFSPISSWILQKIHKLGKFNAKYGIAEMHGEIKWTYLLKRALVAGLLTFSITATLLQTLASVNVGWVVLFHPKDAPFPGTENLFIGEAVFFATFLLTPLTVLLLFPLWVLEDSGVVCYRSFSNQRRSPDIRGVHTMYANILEGYAGISAVFSLVNLIWKAFQDLDFKFDPAILTPIILIILPLLTTGLYAIPLYLYEALLPKIKKRTTKILKLPRIRIPEVDEIAVEGERFVES